MTARTSPAFRRAPPLSVPAQFVLRVAFLAATGVLLVVWLTAV